MSWISVPLCDVKAQYLSVKPEVDQAIARVLERGNYVMGPEVEAFEEEWARYCQARYCVALSSCTDALYLVLRQIKEWAGVHTVLTTPLTFYATTWAVIQAGHALRFQDVDDSGNITPPWHIRGDDAVILPVHLYGRPVELDDDSAMLHGKKGTFIEDAAQGHGIPLKGLAQCHSFYPTKNLGAMGQAGAVVTNYKPLAEALREARNYGERERFVHYSLTGNHRMDELQAAILRAKLPHLKQWTERRRELAQRYLKGLVGVPEIQLPENVPGHVWHIFALRARQRASLATWLSDSGIQTSVRFPVPMHMQPAVRNAHGYERKKFPRVEAFCREVLTLPLYPEMSDEQTDCVIEAIKEWSKCV